MIYDDINKCFNMCEDHLNEGGGKITSVVLRDFNIPDTIKNLIKEDYKTVRKIIDFYYEDFRLKVNNSVDLIDAISKLEFIKIKSNSAKTKFIDYKI